MPFMEGISFSSECKGLLSLNPSLLSSLTKSGKITDYYNVEQTPFARGKFAAVRKCTHKVTGVEYAAKFIRKRRRSMDTKNDIYHEVAVLKLSQNCVNIVSIHEVYETPTEMALVLELVEGGELQRVIDVNDGLDEIHAVQTMQKILRGLSFLHSHNIAHLDLKPQNLLITSSFPNCDIKLCDFGISRVIENGIELREILGTPDYVAPEILNYEPISLATDIWSVGVLTYVLLSGYSPFAGDNKQETFCNIAQCSLTFPPELFGSISEAAKDFIMSTLVIDGSQRMTVEECLQHPWLNKGPQLKCLKAWMPSKTEAAVTNGKDGEELREKCGCNRETGSFKTSCKKCRVLTTQYSICDENQSKPKDNNNIPSVKAVMINRSIPY